MNTKQKNRLVFILVLLLFLSLSTTSSSAQTPLRTLLGTPHRLLAANNFNPSATVGILPPAVPPAGPGNSQTSIGRAPNAPVVSPAELNRVITQMVGEPGYAMEVYPDPNLVYFTNDNPGVWTIIASEPGSQYFAGDFPGNECCTLYVIDYGLNQLVAIDPATGAQTVIGPSVPYADEAWTGMTGAIDGTMYASSTNIYRSTLYTVDLATGAVTVVGEITNAPAIIDIAITPQGEMYGVDIVNDNLVQIDPATGAGTVIGSLGFDANYAQGMDYELESGTLYLAAYSYQGELRIADTTTGHTTLVGAFPGGAEVDSLAFALACCCSRYIISGRITDTSGISIPGVSVSAGPGYNAVTDIQGNFTIDDVLAGTYVVTPTMEGYSFTPPTHTVSMPPDAIGVDFTGEQIGSGYSISGHITDFDVNPIPDVSVSAGPGYSALTDSQGTYTITAVITGTYTVTPSLMGYNFSPPTLTVSVPPDATGVDFTGEQIGTGYSISGHITDSEGNPIPDVSVSAGPGYSALTDSQGAYTITAVISGTYTVTPGLVGYTFSPPWRTVSVPPDATGVDFVYLRLIFLPFVLLH